MINNNYIEPVSYSDILKHFFDLYPTLSLTFLFVSLYCLLVAICYLFDND